MKWIIIASLIFASCLVLIIVAINIWILLRTRGKIKSLEEALKEEGPMTLLVFGAGIINNQEPSQILKARLQAALAFYKKRPQVKIIVSGDCSGPHYDEVTVMKNYLVEHGVAQEDIYKDPKGYSTYESLAGCRSFVQEGKILLLTQKYHLYRALYVAQQLKLPALGLVAKNTRRKKYWHLCREVFARLKDFIMVGF